MPVEPGHGERPQRDFPLHCLVPAQPAGGADRELIHRREPVVVVRFLSRPGLELQETHVNFDGGLRSGGEQALSEHLRFLARAGSGRTWRAKDAELPPRLVLLRRGAVRVEQVALVQDGICHGAGEAQAHTHGSGSPDSEFPDSAAVDRAAVDRAAVYGAAVDTAAAFASRFSTVASHEVRPLAAL